MLSSILLVLLLLQLYCSVNFLVSATAIEDHLETEIDPREPRSFKRRQYRTLCVRQDSFHIMENNRPDGSKVPMNIGNWEVWAFRYWYETRIPNTTCPQLPRGIAAETDWSLMVPCLFGDVNKPPRTIYVHTYMLPHFVESTLHFMDPSYRFVLITAGTDATVPRSVDGRFKIMRGFSLRMDGGPYYQTLLNSPQVIHWYAENHDLTHPKISTLPTGMSVEHPDDQTDYPTDRSQIVPIQKRPIKVLLSDRVRTGTGTWALRAQVAHMCSNSSLCVTPDPQKRVVDSGVSHKEFVELLLSVPFVACVRGGGLDPSPKAWESILVGSIPIIQHNSLDDGYEKLPVVFIQDWKEIFQSPDAENFLKEKLTKLAPYFEEGSELRKKTLEVSVR